MGEASETKELVEAIGKDGVKVTLKSPISVGGEVTHELTLTEPTLGALDGIELEIKTDGTTRIDLGMIPKLLGAMANIPPSSAKQIKASDLAVIGPAVMGFLPAFLQT